MMLIGKSAYRNPTNYLSGVVKVLSSAVLSMYIKEPRKILAARGLGYHELNTTQERVFLVGYFQSYRWANNPDTLQKLRKLRLKSESETVRKFRLISLEEKPVVVHIRLGDYTQIPSFGIPSDEYYSLALKTHFETGKCNKIWLFSNEPEKARLKIPAEYESLIRVIDEVEGSSAKTLEVMRMGCGYVIANSTYSWWGAFLSYASNPLVIAPSPWFKGEPSPHELIPPDWHLLPAWPEAK
jgi:hypothetical protein